MVAPRKPFLTQGESGGSSPGSGAIRLLNQNVPEQTRQHRLLYSHQPPSCLPSLTKPALPKLSEEINCPTYFGLGAMWTPTVCGLLPKIPNRRCSLFHFSPKTVQEQPRNPLFSRGRAQKLLAFHPHQLQVLSTPQEVAPPCLAASVPPITAGTPR